ncbi:hypothetical protein MY10362_002309 [Beauveria mimosiformis]
MSAILLFCTAKVPAQVINRLMEECAIPDDADNIFSLVRNPDQQRLDEWNTEPPVQDFDTGFVNASDAELRSLIEPLTQRSTAGATTSLCSDWIAVLDDKSEAQSAVVLHYSYPEDLWSGPIPALAELIQGEIWFKWRVPFKAVWTLFNAATSCGEPGIELFSRDEYQDSEGVLQAETPTKIINGEMDVPKDD